MYFEEHFSHIVSTTTHGDICEDGSFRIYREKHREKADGMVARGTIFQGGDRNRKKFTALMVLR
jgi:hypothetical protein